MLSQVRLGPTWIRIKLGHA